MSHECMPKNPTHTQTPYVTKNGVETTVDANLAFTLELLKLLGVETFYSCEENYGKSYVLGNGLDFVRLERKIKKLAKQGYLSRDSAKVVKRLFGKQHSIDISVGRYAKNGRPLFEVYLHLGGEHQSCVSKDLHSNHGFRVDWRWPTTKTSEVARMLAEVLQFA
jgi:hypothetical protein